MNSKALQPREIDYFIFIVRYSHPGEQIGTAQEVREAIKAVSRTVTDPDTPLEQIELAVIYKDGGTEGIKDIDTRWLLDWVERIEKQVLGKKRENTIG